MVLHGSIERQLKHGERAGLERLTPCLQSRLGKILNALSGVAYTEIQQDSRFSAVPKVVPNVASRKAHFGITDGTCPTSASLMLERNSANRRATTVIQVDSTQNDTYH